MSLEIYKSKRTRILITILFISFYNLSCFFRLSMSFHSFHVWCRAYRVFSECSFASLDLKCHKELMHTYFSAPAIYLSAVGFICTNWFQFLFLSFRPLRYRLWKNFFRAINYIQTRSDNLYSYTVLSIFSKNEFSFLFLPAFHLPSFTFLTAFLNTLY